ncbi:MAG: Eco57I restriction-modification methylase domain-containing protein [Pseudonocardiaceae bacterium]
MRKSTKQTVTDRHQDWLTQVETDGPFLALPVIKDIWPEGVDRLGDTDDRAVRFKQAFAQWQRELDTYELATKTEEARQRYAEVNRAWIDTVLDLAGWDTDLGVDVEDVEIHSPGEQVRIRPSGALEGKGSEMYAALLLISEPTTSLRAPGLDGWSAHEIDRMAMLLRKAQVECGIVTDGQWWALVWAKEGKPTGSGMVNALTWAEEPLLRDAFLTLIDQKRFRAKNEEQRLPHLFARSELEAEEITEALGTQVRRSVELLVQAFSEARLEATRNHDPDPLTDNPDQIYQAAVTIMMRVVFLLFAEERDMLPTEELYWDSYALRDLLSGLEAQAAGGEEHLDESYDAWHRLLAVSQALYGGVNYDEMRMPAYGGSLLDPSRFPWLQATDDRGLRLRVSDRVMLHVLKSVQTVVVKGERRHISFRDIDVEQIGYIYEGLLGYSCAHVSGDVIVGLIGKDGEEPEIPLGVLNDLYEDSADPKKFAAKLIDWVKKNLAAATPKSASAIAKAVDKEPTDGEKAELVRLLTPVAAGDPGLLDSLVYWGALIRRDVRNIPMVFPIGGLVVVETPSRKNAGAHYTPRSLAEEVVLHALQPLVYAPGPLQTNDESEWRLKSSTAILDLKVADIAAGSGAFLVAAARYLADRVTEAWQAEGMYATDVDPADIRSDALREAIARCLYGADINPMAVEMCKLSLWLVSMDRSKPFSFVDDKIFCGNSLLGLTSEDQVEYLHLYPDVARMDKQIFIDVRRKLEEAARLRRELAAPVDEHNAMRSTRGKLQLLAQSRVVTKQLRQVADGIIAAGLPLGGKPSAKLDDAFKVLSWELQQAFPPDDAKPDGADLYWRIDQGLKPIVETDYDRWEPVHWIVEVPDVMVDHGGFDAVFGNPPFLGGQKLTGSMGTNVRDWFIHALADGRRGSADLVAYFLLRAISLLRPEGTLGLIATNTVAQGDTREVGLDEIVADGFTITRAIQSRSWPAASASLEYAAVWGLLGDVADEILRISDDIEVRRISTLLEPASRVVGNPFKLTENDGIGFIGCYALGMGFVLDPAEARGWIAADPRNAEVLFPYLSGEDLNSRPDASAARWVIDFNDRIEKAAEGYRLPYERLWERVRPERAGKAKAVRESPWWLFLRSRPAMRKATADLSEVLVIARVSKTVMPVRVPTGQVFHEKVVVFASDSHATQAILSSSIHQLWAIKYGTTMRTDPTYTPDVVFGSLPRPDSTARLDAIGKTLDEERREIMLRRELGLTTLYNRVNDPGLHGEPDVDRMREIHVQVDEATLAAYGWTDVSLDHGFHTYRQMERWTVSPAARVEILDRLLWLNHERARAEGQDAPVTEKWW